VNEIRTIPHSLIDPSPLNPRRSVDDTALAELAASIKAEGLLQNLVVRPGRNGSGDRFEIAAGERRFRAIAQLIEAGDLPADHPVPAVVRDLTDLQLLTLATTENMARADMHPLDEARAFARMLELGSDVETIALETGLSIGTIRKRLALVERLAPEVQEALTAGEVNLGQAQALASAPRDRQVQMLEDAPSMSPATLRGWIARDQVPVSRAAFPLDRYKGTYTQASPFDTQGEDTFDDVAQFHELQAAWVEHLRVEYAKRWAWVEVVEYHSPYAFDAPDKHDGPDVLGVVLEHRKHTGELKIHEGLKKRAEPERYGAQPAEKDPLALTKRHEEVLNDQRTRAIQAAIAKDPHAGLAVLALVLIRPYVSSVAIESRSGLLAADLHPHLRRELEAFAERLGARELVHRGDVVNFAGRGRDGAPTLLDRLLALEPEDLVRLVALLTARQVHVGIAGTWVDNDTHQSAAAAIAGGVNAAPHLPTYRQLGQKYLLMYSKPRLEAVAVELCGDHARAWEGLPRKVTAANVFSHVGAELDQVPAELQMERGA
jgi:ParB/RepB/Spo0J family partition protein